MKTIRDQIQEEINQLMSSKIAKRTDAQLMKVEGHTIVFDDNTLNDILNKYNEGITASTLSQVYNVHITKITNILKSKNIQLRKSVKGNNTIDQKEQDILNGMGVKEYIEKWGVSRSSYNKKKQRMKKKLV